MGPGRRAWTPVRAGPRHPRSPDPSRPTWRDPAGLRRPRARAPPARDRAAAFGSPPPLPAVRCRRPWCRRRPLRAPSPAAELRLALLDEGVHALDPVLGRHRELVEPALLVEAGRHRRLLGREHRLLREP